MGQQAGRLKRDQEREGEYEKIGHRFAGFLNVAAGRDHAPHVEVAMPASPMVEITYCRLCGWGLRAGWMAQELLTTFAEELGSVTLTPDITGGIFEVRVDSEVIWSRKERGRFPEIKEIKQLIRDRVAPGRSLGHTDAP
jgi:selenoprotein W-related protein